MIYLHFLEMKMINLGVNGNKTEVHHVVMVVVFQIVNQFLAFTVVLNIWFWSSSIPRQKWKSLPCCPETLSIFLPYFWDKSQNHPAVLITRVHVRECFFHCGKALIRSHLWQPDTWPDKAHHESLRIKWLICIKNKSVCNLNSFYKNYDFLRQVHSLSNVPMTHPSHA